MMMRIVLLQSIAESVCMLHPPNNRNGMDFWQVSSPDCQSFGIMRFIMKHETHHIHSFPPKNLFSLVLYHLSCIETHNFIIFSRIMTQRNQKQEEKLQKILSFVDQPLRHKSQDGKVSRHTNMSLRLPNRRLHFSDERSSQSTFSINKLSLAAGWRDEEKRMNA